MHQHAPTVRLRSTSSYALPIAPAMVPSRPTAARPTLSTTLIVANLTAWVYTLFATGSHLLG